MASHQPHLKWLQPVASRVPSRLTVRWWGKVQWSPWARQVYSLVTWTRSKLAAEFQWMTSSQTRCVSLSLRTWEGLISNKSSTPPRGIKWETRPLFRRRALTQTWLKCWNRTRTQPTMRIYTAKPWRETSSYSTQINQALTDSPPSLPTTTRSKHSHWSNEKSRRETWTVTWRYNNITIWLRRHLSRLACENEFLPWIRIRTSILRVQRTQPKPHPLLASQRAV